jgi:hypothetical protein
MIIRDCHGHALTGAGSRALAHYESALRQLRCFIGDPVTAADAALRDCPDFVMAHVLKAWIHALSTEPQQLAHARGHHAAASRLSPNARERGHLAAVGALIEGRWSDAGAMLEDVAADSPRDLLALFAGHQIDFFRGDSRMLRDRMARALPAWSGGVPGYHALLSMYAFGLEETGNYAEAERVGRNAVALEPRDGWGQHAVAHVMEMQGRQQDGIAWMRDNEEAWSKESFLGVHNWWHLALYHLDLGEVDAVLDLFDGPIYGAESRVALDLIDASAMLWRLHLRGINVGDRWQAVADGWTAIGPAGHYAFNDAHAAMAFVGAGRSLMVEAVLEAQRLAARGKGDNAVFARDVGLPVMQAIKSFGHGGYAETVRLLRPVRHIAHRFGGSHAQRDLIDLTLIEAAFRSGQMSLAAALSAERAAMRPTSPLAALFVQRARAKAKAA